MSAVPALREDVAVLYVDPRGPYPGLVRQWFDEERNARTYDGPLPIVAHPPCGPWGRLRHLSRHDDPAHGPHAVELVRRFGGVLEHPQHSLLFRHCEMPHLRGRRSSDPARTTPARAHALDLGRSRA